MGRGIHRQVAPNGQQFPCSAKLLFFNLLDLSYRTNKQTDGLKISPFYRTSSPTGAAAQKGKKKKGREEGEGRKRGSRRGEEGGEERGEEGREEGGEEGGEEE